MKNIARTFLASACLLGVTVMPSGPASADTWNSFTDPSGDASSTNANATQTERNQADIIKVGYGLNGSNNQNVWFRVTFKDLTLNTVSEPTIQILSNPVDSDKTDSLVPPKYDLVYDAGSNDWNLSHTNRLGVKDDDKVCQDRRTFVWDWTNNFVQVTYPRDCFTKGYVWPAMTAKATTWPSSGGYVNDAAKVGRDFVAGTNTWATTVSRQNLKADNHYYTYGTDVLSQDEMDQADIVRVGYGLNGADNTRIWTRVTLKDLTPGLNKPSVAMSWRSTRSSTGDSQRFEMEFTPTSNTFKLVSVHENADGSETRAPYACSGLQFWWDFDANFVQLSYPRSCFTRDLVFREPYVGTVYDQPKTGAYTKDDTFMDMTSGPVAAGL
jgi:hypothetical protein